MDQVYTAQFKAKPVPEATKGDKAISQIAPGYGVHPSQVRAWRKELIERLHLVFGKTETPKELQEALEKAYKKIEQLKMERDFYRDY